jgi:hypothetical protein
MAHRRRRQQIYDHRLREPVRRTGDIGTAIEPGRNSRRVAKEWPGLKLTAKVHGNGLKIVARAKGRLVDTPIPLSRSRYVAADLDFVAAGEREGGLASRLRSRT